MRDPLTIAYLEDDPVQSSTVMKFLQAESMQCHVFNTAQAMKTALATTSFDAIILDVEIDGEPSGLLMLDHIRQTLMDDTPILVVSAKAYWQAALRSGANDFLEKPLTAKKLVKHIDWMLRPINKEEAIEHYPPYQLNTAQNQITLKGNRVDLSDTEYALAATLFRYFGKVLSHEQLLDNLSTHHDSASSKKIESDLVKIKRKMDLRDIDGWRLESVYKHGYRLANDQYKPCAT